MDWKDALSALKASGSLPEGEGSDVQSEEGKNAATEKNISKQTLHVVVEKKGRGGKTATIIEGFEMSDSEISELAKRMKQKLGTGGSARGGEILIQGDRSKDIRTYLSDLGFKVK